MTNKKLIERRPTGGEPLPRRPPFVLGTVASNLSLFVVFLVTYVVAQAWIASVIHDISPSILVFQTAALFSPQMFREAVKSWTAKDLANFERHFLLDKFIHPALYSVTLALFATREAFLNSTGIPRKLNYYVWMTMIFYGGLCDVLENHIHLSIVESTKGRLSEAKDFDIQLGAAFALMKWLLILPNVAWCVMSLYRRVVMADATTTKKKD